MVKFYGLTIKEITEVNDINCIGDRIVWNDDGQTFRKDIVGFVTYTGLDDNDNKIIFEDSEGKTWTHIGYIPNEINFVVDGKYACEFLDTNGAHQRIICNFNGVYFVEMYGHCPRSFNERYFQKSLCFKTAQAKWIWKNQQSISVKRLVNIDMMNFIANTSVIISSVT